MQPLPGFRDFYPAECTRRNYILETWRSACRRAGFVEYDGPVVEPLALYEKKSGGELVGQLFTVGTAAGQNAEVKGALRPEMTPTLARMVAARERDFKKPLKWFCTPNFFRHERQQRGRLREGYQLNADLIGEADPAADAELIGLLIDVLRTFGLTANDFVIRLSSRTAWADFFAAAGGKAEDEYAFFQVVDKAERLPPEKLAELLAAFSLSAEQVLTFMHSKEPVAELKSILATLTSRGLQGFVEIDYAIVRGLAYYTGVVFEAFDRSKNERALAGGGRYDKLLHLMSDGKTDLPALGFGMGDVVLANLIEISPAAREKMERVLAGQSVCELYVVIADEGVRPQALGLIQQLRDAGHAVDYALTSVKIGKQFQTAEQLGAREAIVIGAEWPQIKRKTLATREEMTLDAGALLTSL